MKKSRRNRIIEPDLGQKLFFTWFGFAILLYLFSLWLGHAVSEAQINEMRPAEVYPKWSR
ncbi:MAG: hypothetical protein R3F20_02145 [Planctomycetota bacterium]